MQGLPGHRPGRGAGLPLRRLRGGEGRHAGRGSRRQGPRDGGLRERRGYHRLLPEPEAPLPPRGGQRDDGHPLRRRQWSADCAPDRPHRRRRALRRRRCDRRRLCLRPEAGPPPGVRGRRRPVMVLRASVLAATLVVLWPARVLAYRPFDQTDADVAAPKAFELELGPVIFQHGPEGNAWAPSFVLNLGIVRDLELVVDGNGFVRLGPLPADTSRWFATSALQLKS